MAVVRLSLSVSLSLSINHSLSATRVRFVVVTVSGAINKCALDGLTALFAISDFLEGKTQRRN